MSQTYSEKVAGLFSVGAGTIALVNGGFLILTVPFFLIYSLWAIIGIANGSLGAWLFFALYFGRIGAYIFDVRLVRGYIRHFQGTLEQEAVDRLWIKTITWNGIFFFPSAYLNLRCLVAECYLGCQPYDNCGVLLQSLNGYSMVFIVLTIWWGIATFVPLLAMASTEDEEPLR